MWVNVALQCPNEDGLIALTRISKNGKTESAGSIQESDLRNLAPILRAYIEHVHEESGEWDTLFAAQNILHHVEVVWGE